MAATLILAIDQGTTGTTGLVMDTTGKTLGRYTHEFPQHFPAPGLVEHDPEEIWQSVNDAVRDALKSAGVTSQSIAAIGITNQRETTVIWERETGRPVHRAIVWQDRRTAPLCKKLRDAGHEALVREKTGLVLDPYFSGTKVAWLLDEAKLRGRAERGDLAVGTIDSYLVWKLSGRERIHITDATNASRTLLLDIASLDWDNSMLKLLGVPRSLLPKVVSSSEKVAVTEGLGSLRDGIPISGIAGDQQAALFGQTCFKKGDVKCTYGTGAFILSNTGGKKVTSKHGLLTTVAWKVNGEVSYALEGSSFIAGAAVQWLRDGLGIIRNANEIEALASEVPNSDGVMFVPALAGLGAPHWDPSARGVISGLTRGTTKAHLARATLDGIAFQVADLLKAMTDDLGEPLARMRVDGGAAANNLLMQVQSDLAQIVVERPHELESTARGAAMLAALGAGLFGAISEVSRMSPVAKIFEPVMQADAAHARQAEWDNAVTRVKSE